ncbi:aromatic acid exporter family protein [Allokutzneria sp. A3M-2-11 16]|uniref:FUSC family protein n=1 Tax=Allokutzneria sp. A3M-2-11 16 TaxID=2962043 RepID=UPI0020B76C0F|nr:aromatic acid exporter family protein [Allokutzneria sp. A3M-2-11 16]MCP3804385.1 aromatic acid exporter family protein [Allokutzneria sp. A3M-2-11 16]
MKFRWVRRAFTTPGTERLVLAQAAKAALAAMLAWLVSTTLLGLPQAFLAPYAAIFAVESTVTGTLRTSVQQVASVASAVLLAALVDLVIPWHTVAIGLATLLGLLIGRLPFYGESGYWVGITAMLILAWGTGNDPYLLGDRLLETILGVGIGTAVNALLFPPFYARPARASAERLAEQFSGLLNEIAEQLRGNGDTDDPPNWPARARHAEDLVRKAERAVAYSRKSKRFNARRRAVEEHGPTERHRRLLRGLRASWPHLHEIADSLRATERSDNPFSHPDQRSRGMLADLLDCLADIVRNSDADRTTRRCERLLAELTELDSPGLAAMVLPARRMFQELTGR